MFFQRVTAKPNECLILIYKSKLSNPGNGASAILWPGSSYALVPTNAQETTFSMGQESEDGIPLRFKGIVIYRIVNPEKACLLFDFSGDFIKTNGVTAISSAINDLCLGELRNLVSNMSMERCLKERKTTLTNGVRDAIIPVVEGNNIEGDKNRDGWGIKIDVVQIAQVFLTDEQMQKQFQSESRDKYLKKEQLSGIKTQREIDFVKMQSEKEKAEKTFLIEKEEYNLKKESQDLRIRFDREKVTAETELRILTASKNMELETGRAEAKKKLEKMEKEKQLEIERIELEKSMENERLKLQKDLEAEKIRLQKKMENERFAMEQQIENQQFEVEKQIELAKRKLELVKIISEVNAIETEDKAKLEREMMLIKKEILPVENIPKLAESLSGVFRNSHVSFYGGENPLLAPIGEIAEMIAGRIFENKG